MNLHEYQAKELLKKFDLPLLKGRTYINNLDTIEKDLNDLSGPPWVVKSQIHAGGRGAGHFKKSFNDKGGNIPEIIFHLVIDKPESVNLVNPPTTIIKATRKVINNNQYEI